VSAVWVMFSAPVELGRASAWFLFLAPVELGRASAWLIFSAPVEFGRASAWLGFRLVSGGRRGGVVPGGDAKRATRSSYAVPCLVLSWYLGEDGNLGEVSPEMSSDTSDILDSSCESVLLLSIDANMQIGEIGRS